MNVAVPAMVAEVFMGSRIVVFSTGCLSVRAGRQAAPRKTSACTAAGDSHLLASAASACSSFSPQARHAGIDCSG